MSTRIAAFCMADPGHFQRIRALTADLHEQGATAHVFTHRRFQAEVEQAGGIFADLFGQHQVDEADDESWPPPMRYVAFAARHAEEIRADVEAVRASLVIHDSFTVIGHVMAQALGLPRVFVCSGHAVVPERFRAVLRAHPLLRISARCTAAVDDLRTRYGIEDASPFLYIGSPSPDLNIYGEPPEFLDADSRRAFEPVAFYGCLPATCLRQAGGPSYFGSSPACGLRVFISFGTLIWNARPREAVGAVEAIARALAERPNTRCLLALGGCLISPTDRQTLIALGMRVEDYVDQWAVLQETDVFVTHHGSNSTHEAVFHQVPMLSYPFIWDQPQLAKTCERLGLAIPLAARPMAPITADDVNAALDRAERSRDAMRAALAVARRWELEVIDARPGVLRRILEVSRRTS